MTEQDLIIENIASYCAGRGVSFTVYQRMIGLALDRDEGEHYAFGLTLSQLEQAATGDAIERTVRNQRNRG